jgi:hypothetical protein
MNSTHSSMLSVSNLSKFNDPPGKCCDVRRMMELSSLSLSKGDRAIPLELLCDSRIRGVKAPLLLIETPGGTGADDSETSEEMLRGLLDPLVAATEGEDGGAGERVK